MRRLLCLPINCETRCCLPMFRCLQLGENHNLLPALTCFSDQHWLALVACIEVPEGGIPLAFIPLLYPPINCESCWHSHCCFNDRNSVRTIAGMQHSCMPLTSAAAAAMAYIGHEVGTHQLSYPCYVRQLNVRLCGVLRS